MTYAVRTNGIGKRVSFRAIRPDFELADDEVMVDQCTVNTILDADGATIREMTEQELADEAAAKAIEEENDAVKRELREIDIASVRSLREYISAQPDAPQFLKDKENAAKAERDKLK